MYWFATAYVILYLLSPFINKFLNSINKNKFICFLILFGLISIKFFPKIFSYSNEIIWFIYMYCVGAYIKLYGIKILENKSTSVEKKMDKNNNCLGVYELFI